MEAACQLAEAPQVPTWRYALPLLLREHGLQPAEGAGVDTEPVQLLVPPVAVVYWVGEAGGEVAEQQLLPLQLRLSVQHPPADAAASSVALHGAYRDGLEVEQVEQRVRQSEMQELTLQQLAYSHRREERHQAAARAFDREKFQGTDRTS